ncbi:MAG: 2Fe-2S iron-sulfur cluster binding domain-containing protein [Acetobacteraceae bacterium]|nr:2Fe-2S iron-sulfur cluster binding domain-containing protein [Acetobacteraceae bacterium]
MHKVTYFQNVTVAAADGQMLLDVSIENRIPHYHQCGGQARCTTCRVQVLDGISCVSPRTSLEQQVASRRSWDEFTRLACQTKVHGDVVIRRLLHNSQDIIVLDLDELSGVAAGEGKELEVAILFSDIRNFTTQCEKSLPHDIVHFLNRYFAAAAEPVLNNNGFVDKYVGDGILAVFGIRGESSTSTCQNAVRAALGMQDAAQRLRPVFEHDFNISIRIGIGIHFGTVILGRIGHPGKRDITVIGDPVNTACRLEDMSKELDVPILLSDSIVAHLPGALRLRPSTKVQLKGRDEQILLYPCEGFHRPDHILLVQSSFDRVAGRLTDFSERFYAILFEANPELRPLFQHDLTIQAKMLASMLSSLVKGLNRMQEIEGGLRMLGKRHRDYKVARTDYDKVFRALLLTLEEFVGDDFTPKTRHAWTAVYGMMAKTMIDAAGAEGIDAAEAEGNGP